MNMVLVDDEYICDLEDIIITNSAPNAEGLTPEEVEALRNLEVGEVLSVGGGAWPPTTFRRVRFSMRLANQLGLLQAGK